MRGGGLQGDTRLNTLPMCYDAERWPFSTAARTVAMVGAPCTSNRWFRPRRRIRRCTLSSRRESSPLASSGKSLVGSIWPMSPVFSWLTVMPPVALTRLLQYTLQTEPSSNLEGCCEELTKGSKQTFYGQQ